MWARKGEHNIMSCDREKKKGRPVLNELVVRLISVPAKEIDFKQAENEIRQVEQNMSESWENDIYYQYL